MTDILAELVLADLKQFPQIHTGPGVDRFSRRENTVLLTQKGGECSSDRIPGNDNLFDKAGTSGRVHQRG